MNAPPAEGLGRTGGGNRYANYYLKFVDALIDWTAKVFSLFIVVVFVALFYEVVARFIFNSPTTWAWALAIQFYAVGICMAGPWLLLKNQEVRVDVIYDRLSQRAQAVVDLITGLAIVVFAGAFAYYGIQFAYESIASNEWDKHYVFVYPLWPVKTLVAVTGCFYLLVLVARYIRLLRIARGRSDFEQEGLTEGLADVDGFVVPGGAESEGRSI